MQKIKRQKNISARRIEHVLITLFSVDQNFSKSQRPFESTILLRDQNTATHL